MLAELFARMQALFRRRQLDDDLDQELQSHLDLLTEEHLRRGLSPEEARRAARLKVGGIPSLKERHREIRGFPLIETVWQDVKFAVRLIFKDRWISAAAIMALALGIGVNAVGFTIVDTCLFPRLASHQSARSLHCLLGWPGRRILQCVARIELDEWRAAHSALSSIAAYSEDSVQHRRRPAFPEQATGVFATANLFGVLEIHRTLMRLFRCMTEDFRAGAEPVVLTGHRMWRDRFASDPIRLGKTLPVIYHRCNDHRRHARGHGVSLKSPDLGSVDAVPRARCRGEGMPRPQAGGPTCQQRRPPDSGQRCSHRPPRSTKDR